MTYQLVALLVVLVVPLLTGSWRVSLAGLGLQGLLMAALAGHGEWPDTIGGVLLLLDLVVVRAWFVPWLVARAMRRLAAPSRSDVIPANLLSWTLAGAAVLMAFRFAGAVEPLGGDRTLHVAVASSAALLGLLVLGTQSTVFAQVVGVLRLEYAVALFELGTAHEPAVPVRLGLSAVLVLSAMLLSGFLERLAPAGGAPDQAGSAGRAA